MTNTKNTDIAQYINYLLDCIRAEHRAMLYWRRLYFMQFESAPF